MGTCCKSYLASRAAEAATYPVRCFVESSHKRDGSFSNRSVCLIHGLVLVLS